MAGRCAIGMLVLDHGVAAAGADDHVAFLEHPALPEHWRHRAKAPA